MLFASCMINCIFQGSHEEDIEEIIRMNLRTIIQAAIILERKSKVAVSLF